MTTRSGKRYRFWLPVIILVLAVALALGGCARASQSGSLPVSGQTTSPSGQTTTSQDLQYLQQVDQQNQVDLNGLGNDQNNANQNNGDDQETQP